MRRIIVSLLLCSCGLCFGDTLILKDGSRHDGTLQSATTRSVTFKENGVIRRYMRANIESIEFDGGSRAVASNGETYSPSRANSTYAPGSRRSVTLPEGTEISVLTNDNIDSATANEGQSFSADVAEDVRDQSGNVVIPKGSEAELILRRLGTQGKITGSSEMVLDLQSVKVNGRRYTISTEDLSQKGNEGLGANKRTATMVGGGAVLGTLIGAIAGGGKGAAIGAATGAAAGAGTEVLTRGKAVKVPSESKLRFKLDQPLYLRSAY